MKMELWAQRPALPPQEAPGILSHKAGLTTTGPHGAGWGGGVNVQAPGPCPPQQVHTEPNHSQVLCAGSEWAQQPPTGLPAWHWASGLFCGKGSSLSLQLSPCPCPGCACTHPSAPVEWSLCPRRVSSEPYSKQAIFPPSPCHTCPHTLT